MKVIAEFSFKNGWASYSPTLRVRKIQPKLQHLKERNIEQERLEKVIKLLIVLAFLLFLGIADNLGDQATPERGKINCISVYLLGNDGAHSYNGNGILFTKHTKSIKYTPLVEEDDHYRHGPVVQILPERPPAHVLLQNPTNQLIAVIAMKIGAEYVNLALFLGLSTPEIDHIKEDNHSAVQRNVAILLRWRDVKERDATIEKLANAFEKLGLSSDIVYNSL